MFFSIVSFVLMLVLAFETVVKAFSPRGFLVDTVLLVGASFLLLIAVGMMKRCYATYAMLCNTIDARAILKR